MSDSYRPGLVLKISIFATGCAGVVAEFVLSTLATYLVGNAVFQWTIVMSLMLFAMGIGSRMSRWFRKELIDIFILTEFSLSVLCAISSVLAYGIASYTDYTDLIIYFQAFVIGTLIGFEIPLVTRINQAHEELRINISAIMEKDYYGALAGGLIFAFFALPYLGLTYTPIVLGCVNFLVASLVLWYFYSFINRKKLILSAFAIACLLLSLITFFAKPVILYGEQKKYSDKVIYSKQTPYQKIVMTRWKEYYWLYINGQEQFSTFDEEKYHEPLVHPAMELSPDKSHVLIIGGGDGLAAREVLKHNRVESVTLVDMDPFMTKFAGTYPVLLNINKGSFLDPRVKIINKDGAGFITNDKNRYGVIIIDLPDPDSIDLMHLYSRRFYRSILKHLIKGGVMVTQATSPFFAADAFRCLIKTVRSAGFSVLPYHNQVPTMGEWGWVLGIDSLYMKEDKLKAIAGKLEFKDIETRFINRDAMISMIYFGKGVLDKKSFGKTEVNTELNPVLFRYYLRGTWGMY